MYKSKLKKWMIVSLTLSIFFLGFNGIARAGTLAAATTLVTPASNIVKESSLHVIHFTTVTSGTMKSIQMVYPTGFNVAGAKLVEVTSVPVIANLAIGTLAVSSQTLTYTITTAPTVAANVIVKITIANIVNTVTPLSNTITVTTRTATPATIDTGTSTAFTLMQVDSQMIGSAAVGTTQIDNTQVQTRVTEPARRGAASEP